MNVVNAYLKRIIPLYLFMSVMLSTLVSGSVCTNMFSSIALHLDIVFVSVSAVYMKTMKRIENDKNQWKSIVCVSK